MRAAAGADAASPPLLMYHRVCRDEARPPSEFVVSARVFRAQLGHLARAGCYTPRLSEVLLGTARPPRPGQRPVVITFDDGYLDNLEVALPILQEHGFTAAIFPVLGQRGRFTWWTADGALHAPLLSPADLRLLEGEGIELGSHTLTHPRLPRLGDRELAHELARSREVLGGIAARPLPVLAYPYGEADARVKAAAREAGYAAALSVHTGPLAIAEDPLEIRRVCVTNASSAASLTLALSGAGRRYRWLRWRAKAGLEAAARWGAPAGTPPRRAAEGSTP